jgi:SAM-dependent methyltransferase
MPVRYLGEVTLDIDLLMQRIRAEIDATHATAPATRATAAATPATTPAAPAPAPPASMRSEALAPDRLLDLHDAEFVFESYRTILGREPDPDGMQHYLDWLRSGFIDRVGVIGALCRSKEGRQRNVRPKQMARRLAVRRLYRVPIVGYAIRLALAIAVLPRTVLAIQNALGVLGQAMQNGLGAMGQAIQQLAATTTRLPGLESQVQQLAAAVLPALESQVQQLAAAVLPRLESQVQRLMVLQEAVAEVRSRAQPLLEAAVQSDEVAGMIAPLRTGLDELRGWSEQRLATIDSACAGTASLTDGLAAWQQTAASHLTRLDDVVAEQSCGLIRINEALRRGEAKSIDLWRHIVDQKRRLDLLLQEARRRLPEDLDPQQLRTLDQQLNAFYVSFEERYRGTREDIKERQRVYLPHIREALASTGSMPVLDLGCGKGEFLELLRDHAITAEGVDLNAVMVAECQERGLTATMGDAIAHLREQRAESLAGVSGFHIIEHLQFTSLIRLFDEAFRVLASGGLLMLETPNPANPLVASETFWLDPTHRNPLPSQTVSFIAEARGFVRVAVLELQSLETGTRPYDDPMLRALHERLYGRRDYGLLAWKSS